MGHLQSGHATQLSIMKRPRVSPSMNGIHVPHAAENSAGTVSAEGEGLASQLLVCLQTHTIASDQPPILCRADCSDSLYLCNWETHQSTIPLHQNNSLECSRLVAKVLKQAGPCRRKVVRYTVLPALRPNNFGLGWSEGIVSPNFVGIVDFRF